MGEQTAAKKLKGVLKDLTALRLEVNSTALHHINAALEAVVLAELWERTLEGARR